MSDVDLTSVSAEALADELSARQQAERTAAEEAELASLQPYIALGFGGQTIDDLVTGLRAQRVSALDTYWSAFLQASLVGLEGMQASLGGRIRYLIQAAELGDEPTE